MTYLEQLLKTKYSLTDKELNNPSFLHGLIHGQNETIESLRKENKQLKNKDGVWVSPETIKGIHIKIEKLFGGEFN